MIFDRFVNMKIGKSLFANIKIQNILFIYFIITKNMYNMIIIKLISSLILLRNNNFSIILIFYNHNYK